MKRITFRHQALLAAVLAGAAAWLAGCGGAGGPTWSSSGPSYSSSGSMIGGTSGPGGERSVPAATAVVRGIVEAPARPTGYGRPVALLDWLSLASPAEAEARFSRHPLSGARVCLIDRAKKQSVSTTVVTDAQGQFELSHVTVSNRFSVQATDGSSTLEAVLPNTEPGRDALQVRLNEATTVGAEAVRQAEDEGLAPEQAAPLAQQVSELQEAWQTDHPAEVPDLTSARDVTTRARQHLLRSADAAIGAALDTKDKTEAWRAFAASQTLARQQWKLGSKVRLTSLQGEALVDALVDKDTRTTTPEKVAEALKKAGVKSKDGKFATPAQVTACVETLHKSLPSLKEVKGDKFPVLVALLLVERGEPGMTLTTREQAKAYMKELVGEIAGPDNAVKGKPKAEAGKKAAEKASDKKGEAPPEGKEEEAKPAEKPADKS